MAIDWKSMPPLTALRAFEATARLQGFTAAAKVLNVTHAAVSQQVRGLEEFLGVPLVVRDGRKLELTADGARLANLLTEGFSTIGAGVSALTQHEGERPVRVSLTASFAAQWLMPRLKDFWADHPEIPISLHPEPRVIDLKREGMDLAIRFGNGSWPGATATFLTSARLVVAGRPDVTGDGQPDIAQLQGMPWIMARDWPEQENWLRAQGLRPEDFDRTEVPNEELALAAAREGLGLIVDSVALLENDVETRRLKIVLDRNERLPAYFIVTLPVAQRKATRIFTNWLLESA
jgi:LysR family transcriptional regulator, glycine cleavage system transcriptional activator